MKPATHAVDDEHREEAEGNTRAAWHSDKFWPASVNACAPLAVWAAHFFACYVFVAVACHAGLDAPTMGILSPLTFGLTFLTLLALGCLALMVARAATVFSTSRRGPVDRRPHGDHGDHGDGPGVFRLGAASLSLVAVAWTSAPILMLSSCAQ